MLTKPQNIVFEPNLIFLVLSMVNLGKFAVNFHYIVIAPTLHALQKSEHQTNYLSYWKTSARDKKPFFIHSKEYLKADAATDV